MDLTPEQADAAFAAIVAAAERNDRPTALRLAVKALADGLDEPLALLFAAEAHDSAGEVGEALRLLRRAAAIAPEEPEIWHQLGVKLGHAGETREALAAFRQALSLAPDIVATLIEAGSASFRLGELTAAEDLFARAQSLDPDRAEPLAGRATVAARRGNPAAARQFAQQALALTPQSFPAEMALARADLLEGRAVPAAERMDAVLGWPSLGPEGETGALDLRAEAYDALDRCAAAFADYTARNAILRRLNAPRVGERSIEDVARLNRFFAAADPLPWQTAPAGPDGPAHVFLLGFPRSGTTLLEKALAAHPSVITLEEIDHLATVGRHWLRDEAGLTTLARLTETEAAPARAAYWRAIGGTMGDITGKVIVDKLPLHTLALPLIAKLFPRAKILFALRDPRDVVFSCFRRRFQVNAAMFEFLDLDDAVRFYEETMAFASRCRALLAPPLLEVRHERLVLDFPAEISRVLAFLGLSWDQAIATFTERGRADPRTPSDLQLARGLNHSGFDQWRRYAPQLASPFVPLAPWVRAFGYPES